MKTDRHEKAEWHAAILTLIVLGVILGIEQALPLSESFRSQIGVLTVLLIFGFWYMVHGLMQPHES